MRVCGRLFPQGFSANLLLETGRIAAIEPGVSATVDLAADWLTPPLCEVQVNGALGISFTAESLTTADFRRVVQVCRAHGIGQLLPTVVTASRTTLVAAFANLQRGIMSDPDLAAAVPGFHLEGPFISGTDGPRGAHPAEHVRLPDLEEFCQLQACAGGLIRLVTLAPELPGAIEFIRAVSQQGVLVAVGHSAADPQTIRDAVAAGARLCTHLGNGAPRLLPRHHNLLWEQLADDRLWASVIADGHHLPEAVLRCILRCKGPQRLLLTCDISPWGGMPPGIYGQWQQAVEVRPEGKIVLAGQELLAGSWHFTDACVSYLSSLQELTAPEIFGLVITQPRRLLGLPGAELNAGSPANLLAWKELADGTLRLQAVIWEGQLLQPLDR